MKKVLMAIVALILLLLVISLIAPKEFPIEREVIINCPKDEVFQRVRSLEFQEEWSVWGKLDPNAQYTYTGVDGTVGSVQSWEGNKDLGKGEQEITGITEGERIDFEIRFIKPYKSTSDLFITTEALGESETLVKWGMVGKIPVPMNLYMLFSNMNKTLGTDLEEGLQNLKMIMEGA
ncbi:MAG: SRPBCC family protein [Bacteroides sp.]|nr:SRPBCC family protein [Bacteroides sp.]